MKKSQIVRAWRDPNYRRSLTTEQRARMGVHPAGATMIQDGDLQRITGGCSSKATVTTSTCTACGGRIACTYE